tara:strand:+ start:120 stop:581 length:462 start_codon:yes stop_codon:yes gene_type:complete
MHYKSRISVFRGRDINEDIYKDTVEIGRQLAIDGYLVFCGGGKGVMEAIAKGVNEKNGTIIGILKGKKIDEGNKFLTIPIATGIDIGRNAILAYNCDVAIAISGKYGTMSEIAYAFQLKKPVIGFKTWEIDKIVHADTPKEVMLNLKEQLEYV